MSWSAALSQAVGAAIFAAVSTVVAALVGLVIARAKLLPLWHQHQARQQQILEQQDLILQRLGDPEEHPIS